MKILAFSDLHRDQKSAEAIVQASEQADVIVGAGDFSTAGKGATDTIRILQSITRPTILVPGNHDDLGALRAACDDWNSATVLHGEKAVVEGVEFFGLGMEIPQQAQFPWNSYMSEDEAARALSKCPKDSVLVTHSPPLGGVCDVQADGQHVGSEAIVKAINTKQPRFCLCGHIHDAWGTEYSIGRCRIANLGPTLNWFELPQIDGADPSKPSPAGGRL